jgi:AcrR family transcriptional regulator
LVDQPNDGGRPRRRKEGTVAQTGPLDARARTAAAARPPVSPRPTVAADRRAAIVRATIRCLARDGYAGLTMKRVAAEAGLSPGILHYYFRDKRAILARAAATVVADLDRRVATEARGARDARGRLRGLVRACLRVAMESRDFWTVFIELWGEALHDRELARLNRRAYARARRVLARGIALGTGAGAFRPVAPDEAAVVILALVDGLSLQLTFDPDLMPLGRAVRLAEDALGAYLAPAGGAP